MCLEQRLLATVQARAGDGVEEKHHYSENILYLFSHVCPVLFCIERGKVRCELLSGIQVHLAESLGRETALPCRISGAPTRG